MSPAGLIMPDLIGYVLDGRYELLSTLGSGSFGVVYKALDLKHNSPSDDRFRAIKIVYKANRRTYELEAVRREVELQSLVTGYPNIVGIHDAFEDENYFYLVLDLCLGGDLFQQICCRRAFAHNDEHLRRTFLQIVDAVESCHEANVFHRDLKPENILINTDGSEVFLADFGLATQRPIVDECGCGTQVYMSPEVVGQMTDRQPFDTRYADIWALGVILVNMITSRQPWCIASSEDCCFSTWLEDRDFLKQVFPISDGANLIIQRIFQLEPLDRISLSELRREIRELDTFFPTSNERIETSDLSWFVAADVRQPLTPQVLRPPRRPPPRPLRLPELKDILGETGSTCPSQVPSLTAQRGFDIPAPQRYYTGVEEKSPIKYAVDHSTSKTSASSRVADQSTGAVKVGQVGSVVGTFEDEKVEISKHAQALSPVYG
ncbi:transporter [Ganoderma sinense ZZ0214-1]|uniref:Transporter n=1 Tax=Ganoderma sinense ZZ0214-1 TaxID=1077348 RepID=A0A2G8S797_9APHY|nr:transporter [Ganoderma sinense ZZ0214-1]